jgi:AraC-like DNA-binding protein
MTEMETDTVPLPAPTRLLSSSPDRRQELRAQLAERIASLIGSAPSLSTSIPGVTLYRHTAPAVPDRVIYEPSMALVVQGRKRVTLGAISFEHGPSRFLLTSLELPVTSQVVEASSEVPYLCLRLKLLRMDVLAEIACYEVGYESASQFNREYSRAFGQPPMRDVRALRVLGDG